MAVSTTGTPSDVTGNTNVTVPVGCDCAWVCWNTWSTTNGVDLNTLTLNGVAITRPASSSVPVNGDANATGSGYWLSPASGTQAVVITWTGAISDGPQLVLVYLTGVDQLDPVRDADAVATSNAGSTTQTVTLTTNTGDFVIGMAGGGGGASNGAPVGSGQTIIVDDATNGASLLDVATEDVPGSATTAFSGTAPYCGVAAIAFKASGAVAATGDGTRGSVQNLLRRTAIYRMKQRFTRAPDQYLWRMAG